MQNQIEQLYNPLLLFIKKRINNPLDAEDLTQEVFYKLSRSQKDDVSNIKSWVYTIAKNTIIDYYRKNKQYTEEIKNIALPEDSSTNNEVVSELSNCIIPFIKQLPQAYQEILSLSEIEGVSQKEIAERMDVNYTTVRSKVQRGRQKLKALITDCCTVIQGGKGSIMEYKKNDCKRDC